MPTGLRLKYNTFVQNKPTGFISPDGPGLTARALLGPLIADAPIGLALVDNEFRFVFVNATLAVFNGRPAEEHIGVLAEEVLSPEIWEQVLPCFEKALVGDSIRDQDVSGTSARDGGMRHYLVSYYPVQFDRRTVVGIGLVVNDITERKQSEALVAGQNHILEGILQGAPLLGTLSAIVRLIESQLPGTRCSILLLDAAQRRLRLGAAPSLPAGYSQPIAEEGVCIGPDAGPCGIAAFLGQPVACDDLNEYGDIERCALLGREAGVRGCRSTPIRGERDEILGTFGLFYTDDRRKPDIREPDLVAAAAYLARIAIERDREEVRRRILLRDMLLSLTEGKLRLCWSATELPAPLSERQGEPVPLTSESLRPFRWSVTEVTKSLGMPIERRFDLETAVGEAAMNAVVHAGGGEGMVYADSESGTVQVWVRDQGHGIAEESLHRATLERGFTTAGSLGHGFWMVLKTVDRIYLLTGEGGTTVVLEQDREPFEPDWLGVEGLL